MHQKIRPRRLLCLLCLLLSVLLGLAFPHLRMYMTAAPAPLPPGIRREARELINVWVLGDTLGMSPWLRAQCAAFSRAQKGVSVWVRSVSKADMALWAEDRSAGPDVIVFAAGERVDPDLLTESTSAAALSEAYAAAGRLDGRQLAVPLCLSGYALLERTGEAAQTPPPRSLFGVTATPPPAPEATPPRAAAWPSAFYAGNGFGALALASMDAPTGAVFLDEAAVLSRFMAEENACALLTVAQARQCGAQGTGFQVLSAAAASDLVVFAARGSQSSETSEALLSELLSEAAQQALSAHHLLPARKGVILYGGNQPMLYALSASLRDGWLANAFFWPDEGADTLLTAQALYQSGSGARVLLN